MVAETDDVTEVDAAGRPRLVNGAVPAAAGEPGHRRCSRSAETAPSTRDGPHATDMAAAAGPQWTCRRSYGSSYLASSAAFFSTSSMPPQRKNACSGRWS